MHAEKRAALEAAGWRFGDAADFLGLTAEERQLVELRVALSREIRCRRERQQMTQAQLAAALGSSQSRIAKIEAGAGDVSLDLLFRSLFVVGGRVTDVASPPKAKSSKARRVRS